MENAESSHTANMSTVLAEELFREIENHHSQRRDESNEAPTTCLISRVNDHTRLVDPAGYDPQYVSIGPYHHQINNSSSLARNAEKIASLYAVVRPASETALRSYLHYLGNLDTSAMSCYANTFPEMTKRETSIMRMLLLDGCYILFQFVPADNANPAARSPDKHVPVEIESDVLYLLSNQIPFSVLEQINTTAHWSSTRLVDVFSSYIKRVLEHQGYAVNVPAIPPERRPSHLLHLLHMHFERSREPDEAHDVATGDDSGKRVRRWRRAMEYQMAGVSFKSRELKGDSTATARSILDVQLSCRGATLMVPRLNVDNETWRILRNLTALEQDNPAALGSRVTAYCMFMSQVACTAEDVALLSRKRVVEHQMGDDAQCAKCFADLCKGVAFDVDDREHNYLWSTCRALDRRFRSRRSNWMAWLQRKYFSNPWLAIGLVSAAILLACAVVQSVYSVLSYYKPC